MTKLEKTIKDIEDEIKYDEDEIRDYDEKILLYQSCIDDLKANIRENRELLIQLKSLLNKN